MVKIFVNNDAVMEHQRVKEISPLSARQVLEENIASERSKLNGSDSKLNRGHMFDKAEVTKNIKTLTQQYDKGRPETLSSDVTNTMWKRAKQLKDEFTVGMLTRDELHPVKGFLVEGAMKYVIDDDKVGALNSVKRELEWSKKNEPKIKEYKNIMRHLCPDDPSATDVEKFRQRKRIG
jgi:hypothetical protein